MSIDFYFSRTIDCIEMACASIALFGGGDFTAAAVMVVWVDCGLGYVAASPQGCGHVMCEKRRRHDGGTTGTFGRQVSKIVVSMLLTLYY